MNETVKKGSEGNMEHDVYCFKTRFIVFEGVLEENLESLTDMGFERRVDDRNGETIIKKVNQKGGANREAERGLYRGPRGNGRLPGKRWRKWTAQ